MLISVYDASGQVRARDFIYLEDAAALVAFLGEGATIRSRRRVYWREGSEVQAAAESYDFVAETVVARYEAGA